MPPERVITDDIPCTGNPYSQGVVVDGTLYVSGYGPVDPEMGEETDGDIEAQTDYMLDNITTVVSEAGGGGLDDAMKLTVYVTDLDDCERVNEAYDARFDEVPPARACVEVARLPGGVRVEVDAIAYLG